MNLKLDQSKMINVYKITCIECGLETFNEKYNSNYICRPCLQESNQIGILKRKYEYSNNFLKGIFEKLIK